MNEHQLDKLKNSKQMACDGWVYSTQRMDLLIITISSAGIYVALETLKYAHEKNIGQIWLLKTAGLCFVISIIANFISQSTGQKANMHHIHYIDEQLAARDNPTQNQINNIAAYNCDANFWHHFTSGFNIGSMILMFMGLTSIVGYFIFMF